jgi:hypothetical protein
MTASIAAGVTALEEVERILAPVKDLAWASGKAGNQ